MCISIRDHASFTAARVGGLAQGRLRAAQPWNCGRAYGGGKHGRCHREAEEGIQEFQENGIQLCAWVLYSSPTSPFLLNFPCWWAYHH